MTKKRIAFLVTLALCIAVAAGCSRTPATNFYLLSPGSEAGDDPIRRVEGKGERIIGVGPILIPEYLNRKSIVTRIDDHKVRLSELHRWAEPLDASAGAMIEENLAALLPDDRFAAYPWEDLIRFDYQVIVEIEQFDGSLPGDCALQAKWVVRGAEAEFVRRGEFFRKRPIHKKDYTEMARVMSALLGDLSAEIAADLENLP